MLNSVTVDKTVCPEKTFVFLYNQANGHFCVSEKAYLRFAELKSRNDDTFHVGDAKKFKTRCLHGVKRHDADLLQVYNELGKETFNDDSADSNPGEVDIVLRPECISVLPFYSVTNTVFGADDLTIDYTGYLKYNIQTILNDTTLNVNEKMAEIKTFVE